MRRRDGPAGSAWRGTWWAGAWLAAGALPLLVARPAALQDWPNHLARVAIEAALLRGDPFWARYYAGPDFAVPNAALDLGVLGLHAAGLPLAVAGQVFLLGVYAAFVGGFLALSRALGASGPEKPVLAVLVFYGHALFWGLVNYVLGVGLLLGMLAAWLPAQPAARTAIALVAPPLLVFVHPVPAVVLGLLMAAFDAPALVRRGARWRAYSGLVAVTTVWLALLALPGSGHGAVYAGGPGAGAFVAWKLRVVATVLLGGGWWQDAASALALAVVLAVLLPSARRPAAGVVLALAGLTALVIVAPERLGEGSLLDVRLAWLPMVLGAAVMQTERLPRAAVVALALAVGLRTAVLAEAWVSSARVFARFERAAAALPPGGVMMMAYGTPLDRLTWWDVWAPPIQSLATGVVARRLFFPAIFANPAQQPLARRAGLDALAQPWDLTGPAAAARAAAALGPLCRSGAFAGVFLTVLYPGRASAATLGPAVLAADRRFLILDGCRLAAR